MADQKNEDAAWKQSDFSKEPGASYDYETVQGATSKGARSLEWIAEAAIGSTSNRRPDGLKHVDTYVKISQSKEGGVQINDRIDFSWLPSDQRESNAVFTLKTNEPQNRADPQISTDRGELSAYSFDPQTGKWINERTFKMDFTGPDGKVLVLDGPGGEHLNITDPKIVEAARASLHEIAGHGKALSRQDALDFVSMTEDLLHGRFVGKAPEQPSQAKPDPSIDPYAKALAAGGFTPPTTSATPADTHEQLPPTVGGGKQAGASIPAR